MKIGSIDTKPVAPASTGDRKVGSGAASPSGGPAAEASAKVALSPAATLLSKVADDPAFDAQKVDRIASAIRDGTYKINAEAIADKLLVTAEELLGRKLNS